MFSVETPLISVAAWPPAPMAAMFSFSLGDTRRDFGRSAGAAHPLVQVSIKPEAAAVEVKMNWRRRSREALVVMARFSMRGGRAVNVDLSIFDWGAGVPTRSSHLRPRVIEIESTVLRSNARSAVE